MRPRTFPILLAALAVVRCAGTPLSPAAARIPVYQAPLDAPPAANRMPGGCEEVARQPLVHWSELDLTGVSDAYDSQRNRTAGDGGNVLLVLTRQIVPRQCLDCPAASPITDCPPCEGAWFDVVFVSYACPTKALTELPPERLP